MPSDYRNWLRLLDKASFMVFCMYISIEDAFARTIEVLEFAPRIVCAF